VGRHRSASADIVVEVVSDDPAGRTRDYEDKRRDYATARIPEYWIVDPARRRITVLGLEGDAYVVAGEFAPGDTAASNVLEATARC
jgi:Uma2 family endonuclease